MSVGEKIKTYLTENGISQTWLSEKTKIAMPKLNASLKDKRKMSANELALIIDVLGVDANKFLKDE